MNISKSLAAAVLLVLWPAAATAQENASWIESYRPQAERIIRESLSSNFAWNRLADLTDSFGSRLSGAASLERALSWALEKMQADGLENVHLERVMVPRWVRGSESAEIVAPFPIPMAMLGLGGSAATPTEGVEAEVLVVRSFSELAERGKDARGRIVVFNVPFTTYGETVQYRSSGASRAARYGARAVLVRSVGPTGLRTPHTGAMRYAEDAPRIPIAAIAAEDADRLQRMQERGERAVARLKMESHFEPDAASANLVGEIRGREKPEEVVLIGGHLDSWDVGTGASDDGAGCIATWEAARILRKLELRPRRTIRVVLFTNEENGGRGGAAYRDAHLQEAAGHVLALEADSGLFPPLSLGFTGSGAARSALLEVAALLKGLGMDGIGSEGGGADIGPIVQAGKIPAMALGGDATAYFTIHHTAADTVDRVPAAEVSRAAAAIAVMAYAAAEMPERLAR